MVVSALVFGIFFSVSQAHADTQNITVSPNMTIGSTGANVVTLQALMSELGYLNVPMGIPFGYYGTMTKNAVAAYQANLNVSPAVGYYGPVTKIALFTDFNSHGWTHLLGWSL
jgi:peptidoglycan hydrolase-like protein with peptidoglycan-binding domain